MDLRADSGDASSGQSKEASQEYVISLLNPSLVVDPARSLFGMFRWEEDALAA